MPKKRNEDFQSDFEPQNHERLLDFLPIDRDWPEKPERPTAAMLAFKNKSNEIYKAGRNSGLENGEIHAMININFGYWNRDIPWGKMEEIKQWVINNAFRNLQILSPDYHNILMKSENTYSLDFRKKEKTARTEW